jgi:Membrane proteins related to metalloendopeptidases
MHLSSPFSRLLTSRIRIAIILVVAAWVAAGCASRRPAPVEDRVVSRPPPAEGPQTSALRALPPAEEPATYTVKRGDTLHQIALDSGLDYRELAAWNNIENVNRIFPGQVLRLSAPGSSTSPVLAQESPGGVTTAPLRAPPAIVEARPTQVPAAPNAAETGPAAAPARAAGTASNGPSNLVSSPKAIKEPYSEQAVRDLNLAASAAPAPRDALARLPAASAEPKADARPPSASAIAAAPSTNAPGPAATPPSAATGDGDELAWAWPAKGKIVAGFSETSNLKGIDIAGTAGEAVRASAPGRVVYAGSGLRGYGKLIIIKHNATFLSAYAHNREILVKEGQQVTRGQKIAEMGNSDADQVKLHFEIRRHGKPVDPAKYLPPA